jgi:peptidoglycan/xylan/chitin deacetylase (PgdA/CDA1 family)
MKHALSKQIITKRTKQRVIDFMQATIGNFMLAFPFLNNVFRYKKDSLRIGYYHIVSSQSKEYLFHQKKISPEVFKEQLSFLKKHFHIISLNEALQMAEKKQSFYRKLVLTFDDGFSENYSVVAPILKERKIPATFFLIGNCIDNKDLMWRNKLLVLARKAGKRLPKIIAKATTIFGLPPMYGYENILNWSLRTWPMAKKEEIANYCWNSADVGTIQEYLQKNQPFLTAEQIRSLISEGFEIGSHSMSHPVFSRLSYHEFEEEILASVHLFETMFGQTITSFSYPFGIKANRQFEQKLIAGDRTHIKTLLGSKNRLDNYLNCLQWERDNLEFPMNKTLFRLNIMPVLRRFA